MHQPRHEKEKYIRCSWKGPVAQGEGKLKVSILSVFQLQFYFWSLTVQTVEVLGSRNTHRCKKKRIFNGEDVYIWTMWLFMWGIHDIYIKMWTLLGGLICLNSLEDFLYILPFFSLAIVTQFRSLQLFMSHCRGQP